MIVHFWHTSKQPSSRWPFCTFGLTIILKKTEVYQKPPQGIYRPPKFNIDGHPLNAVDQFINLGSITSNNVSITKDMDNRLAKACSPFGRPQKPVWQNHSLRLTTKIQVYKTVVLSTLLYWSESWVLIWVMGPGSTLSCSNVSTSGVFVPSWEASGRTTRQTQRFWSEQVYQASRLYSCSGSSAGQVTYHAWMTQDYQK